MVRLRDGAADHHGRAVGSCGEARRARGRVGQVHGFAARGLASHRQADRAREEVGHPGLRLPQADAREVFEEVELSTMQRGPFPLLVYRERVARTEGPIRVRGCARLTEPLTWRASRADLSPQAGRGGD